MWRKPTEEDVVATLSRDELDAYQQTEFDHNPIETLLERTASYVRGYLSTNGNIRLSPEEHAIPEATVSPAMDYLAVDICKRIGLPVTEDRRTARKEAIAYFEAIAAGRITVESYCGGTDDTTGGPAIAVVTAARARVSAHKLEGL